MKLFKIWQEVNLNYNNYDSAVVCANSEDEARKIHPYEGEPDSEGEFEESDWANNISEVNVEYLGEAKEGMKQGIICASYNEG